MDMYEFINLYLQANDEVRASVEKILTSEQPPVEPQD